MDKKTLSFEVHAQGTLEKAVETPIGVLYVDTEHEVMFIESDKENAFEKMYGLTCIANMSGVEGADGIRHIMREFAQLKKDQVTKDGENYKWNASISGSLEEAVENKYGHVYVSSDHRAWYFEAKHPDTFLEKIEFEKFVDNIAHDMLNPEIAENAIGLLLIMKSWVRLDNEDIVKS